MASRFAVLDNDVDLDDPIGKKKQEKNKTKNDENNKKTSNKPNNKKKKAAVPDGPSLQALAFGGNYKKNKKKAGKPVDTAEKEVPVTKPKPNSQADPRVDEDWQRRDNEMTGKPELEHPEVPNPNLSQEEETFFHDVEEATRKTLERETKHENYKATAAQYNQEVRAVQYEAELEKRDFEIQALRLEVDSLKSELKLVKGRNKKLCEVICCAEMKSKAELVVELDKMTKVREELTQEVSNLSAQVEQERSKVNQLTLDLKKYYGKKKQNSEAASKD